MGAEGKRGPGTRHPGPAGLMLCCDHPAVPSDLSSSALNVCFGSGVLKGRRPSCRVLGAGALLDADGASPGAACPASLHPVAPGGWVEASAVQPGPADGAPGLSLCCCHEQPSLGGSAGAAPVARGRGQAGSWAGKEPAPTHGGCLGPPLWPLAGSLVSPGQCAALTLASALTLAGEGDAASPEQGPGRG